MYRLLGSGCQGTEIVQIIRIGVPRTATSTFTHLLISEFRVPQHKVCTHAQARNTHPDAHMLMHACVHKHIHTHTRVHTGVHTSICTQSEERVKTAEFQHSLPWLQSLLPVFSGQSTQVNVVHPSLHLPAHTHTHSCKHHADTK